MYCLASLLEWQEHNGMHAPDQPGESWALCPCMSRQLCRILMLSSMLSCRCSQGCLCM